MKEITVHRQLKIRPKVRSMRDDAGAVLLDLKAGKYYSLNAIGSTIWTQIEEGRAWPEILDHLRETYQVPVEVIARDAETFVADLAKRGLIDGS